MSSGRKTDIRDPSVIIIIIIIRHRSYKKNKLAEFRELFLQFKLGTFLLSANEWREK